MGRLASGMRGERREQADGGVMSQAGLGGRRHLQQKRGVAGKATNMAASSP